VVCSNTYCRDDNDDDDGVLKGSIDITATEKTISWIDFISDDIYTSFEYNVIFFFYQH